MGVLYIPRPLDEEEFADAEGAAWLNRSGIEPPTSGQHSRWPTVAELRTAIGTIEGCEAQYLIGDEPPDRKSFGVEVCLKEDRPYKSCTQLYVLNYDGDESKEANFYFSRGAVEVVLLMLKKIAHTCGPYTIYGDDAAIPALIDADTDLDEINSWWTSERERLFDEWLREEAEQKSSLA